MPDKQPESFGKVMHMRGLAVCGRKMGDKDWKQFLQQLAFALRMTPCGSPAQWDYPTVWGSGGNGTTYVQPITESFLAIDTWDDHRGAYILICSCRAFDDTLAQLRNLLHSWGLRLCGEVGHNLKIQEP